MALTTASLVALDAAVTAEATASLKTSVLMAGLIAAVLTEIQTFPPRQLRRVTRLAAEVEANKASFVTALTVE